MTATAEYFAVVLHMLAFGTTTVRKSPATSTARKSVLQILAVRQMTVTRVDVENSFVVSAALTASPKGFQSHATHALKLT